MSTSPAKRVQRIGGATLYLGDCLEILPTLGPAAADALIADPPYGIGYVQGREKSRYASRFAGVAIIGDDRPFDPSPFLKIAPRTVLFGANHYADKLPASACWLVWDKRERDVQLNQADCEMAWCSRKAPARMFRHMWSGYSKASERGEARVHPTQKPVALMRWVIEQAQVPEGGTILDPFMGSGTTGVAAIEAGRRFIGIELDPGYFEHACRRIAAAVAQPRLALERKAAALQGPLATRMLL